MVRQFIALTAALATSASAFAADTYYGQSIQSTAATLIFVSFPLDAASRKDKAPAFGLALQGNQRIVSVDTRMLNNLGIETLAGFDVKWLLAGAAAAAAAAAVGSSSPARAQAMSTSQNTQQQQQPQNPPPPPTCPTPVTNPCR